jgi:glycosyltransferase involved in cell wall biosynthesis
MLSQVSIAPHMPLENKLNVLMITGVYLPEINGAVLQCSQLINKLEECVNYSVLTCTNDESMEGCDYIDGVRVTRIFMSKERKLKYIIGAARFFLCLTMMLRKTDLVHIHGFSKRNAIVILSSMLLRKKVVIKMTSYGHDDAMSIKNYSPILWSIFKCCHAYIGISPAFLASYQESGLSEHKYNFIPNGVNLDRYSPISTAERKELRGAYGFAEHDNLIVFVGHFSPEKRPTLLYKAWVRLCKQNIFAKLIFIGHTKDNFEVDEGIAESIKQDGFLRGVLSLIHFVEETPKVEDYMKIADVFVLPSIREGMPNVLLEAMACALPVIVSDLPGVTDWLIEDGVTGVLFSSDDPDVLANTISPFFMTSGNKQKMGMAARHCMERNFSFALTSQGVLDLYRKMSSKNTVRFNS